MICARNLLAQKRKPHRPLRDERGSCLFLCLTFCRRFSTCSLFACPTTVCRCVEGIMPLKLECQFKHRDESKVNALRKMFLTLAESRDTAATSRIHESRFTVLLGALLTIRGEPFRV